MAEQLARQEKETVSCAKEATKIEGFLQTTRQALTAALTDDETPGVITQAEADEIARVMMRNASAAHAHTKHLNALL
ncbi:MAG: hypothetical protein Q8M02_10485 [Candidatus Didemnitutus sp.]|nr:hypothetical protein [Candidatus Didemnitutus sp.]